MSFHTCHGDGGLQRARRSPADGGNATFMHANCHKTQQKKKKNPSEAGCACTQITVAGEKLFFSSFVNMVNIQKALESSNVSL